MRLIGVSDANGRGGMRCIAASMNMMSTFGGQNDEAVIEDAVNVLAGRVEQLDDDAVAALTPASEPEMTAIAIRATLVNVVRNSSFVSSPHSLWHDLVLLSRVLGVQFAVVRLFEPAVQIYCAHARRLPGANPPTHRVTLLAGFSTPRAQRSATAEDRLYVYSCIDTSSDVAAYTVLVPIDEAVQLSVRMMRLAASHDVQPV